MICNKIIKWLKNYKLHEDRKKYLADVVLLKPIKT